MALPATADPDAPADAIANTIAPPMTQQATRITTWPALCAHRGHIALIWHRTGRARELFAWRGLVKGGTSPKAIYDAETGVGNDWQYMRDADNDQCTTTTIWPPSEKIIVVSCFALPSPNTMPALAFPLIIDKKALLLPDAAPPKARYQGKALAAGRTKRQTTKTANQPREPPRAPQPQDTFDVAEGLFAEHAVQLPLEHDEPAQAQPQQLQETSAPEETFEDFADLVVQLADPVPAFRCGNVDPHNVAALRGTDILLMLQRPRPTTIPTIAAAGLASRTAQEHRRLLANIVKWMPDEVKELPLPTALVETLMRRRRSQKWRWSSTLKTLASLQGALKLLPMYHADSPSLLLGQCPVWRQMMRAVGHMCRAELPHQPLAAVWQQVEQALRTCTCLITFAAILLSWQTTARVGCTLQLAPREVKVHADRTLTVTFTKGKGVALRKQAYSVHTPAIPAEFMPRLQRFLDERASAQGLFPNPQSWGAKVRTHLRTIDPRLEQRSLRRGSLQALSKAPGMTDKLLLLFSGHSSELTLRRYLNWGAMATHTRKEMVAGATTLNVTTA